MKPLAMMFCAVLAFTAMLTTPAQAHHGWAAFNHDKTVSFKGKVTVFRFLNPHSVVEFDTIDEAGKTVNWQGELTSASRLGTKGWVASSLNKGDEINIVGYPAKSGVPTMRISKLTLADGKQMTIVMDN